MEARTPLYLEFVDFVAAGTTPEGVANFRPSVEAQERVAELVERDKDAKVADSGPRTTAARVAAPAFSEEEAVELSQFLELEHILRLAKARARLMLANRT